jgi:hypothetical protein
MLAVTESIDLASLKILCPTYDVRRLAIFGSVSRGEQRPRSDVDLLVEYQSGFTPSLFKMTELCENLRAVFGGRQVDLVLPSELHWFIRDQVLSSAQTIYDEG